ncbi:MAG: segregation/condensation protein A [Bacilli bacterium]|nr:segregation/condensation protein A [Bacilli bacterium]
MDYTVKIDAFDGPLDLLLHLIKQSNIDICDIQVHEITKQYLEYIEKMEELNLNVASEYLVMASELIEMKSRTLLPTKVVEEDGYEEDPRAELIQKLIDYNRYKEVTHLFKELEQERKKIYTKEPSMEEYRKPDTLEEGISLDQLLSAFQNFLDRRELEKPMPTKITTKEYSVHKRNEEIRSLLKIKKQVTFKELFTCYQKDYIVVTFLSILDLAKKQELELKQPDNFDEIVLVRKER